MKDSVLWAIFKQILPALALAMLICGPVWGQATRRDINQIRRKHDNISPQDIQRLQEFIQIQFEQMEVAAEPTQLNQPVRELEEISTSQATNPIVQQQYTQEYARAVQSCYEKVFQYGQALAQQDSEDQKKLGAHLKLAAVLPLAAGNDPLLIDDLLKYLQDDSPDVRHCVVKGLARENIQRQLSQADASDPQVQKVLNGLEQCLQQVSSPEVIMQIATAANLPGKPNGLIIIRNCAAKRTAQYRTWQVNNESADGEIMRQVLVAAEREWDANNRTATVDLMREATMMFWAAHQRYSQGKNYRTADKKLLPILSEQSKQQLKTIMILGEQDIIRICNKALNNNRARPLFLPALQDQNDANLDAAFTALLGPNGVVQQAFNIYDNWTNAPADFPGPPEEVVKKAENRLKIKENSIIGQGT